MLTQDHTPPKGCVRPSAVEIRRIVEHLSQVPNAPPPRLSQNGSKYRTLCSDCNNRILGSICDPELNRFANELSRIVSSDLEFPSIVTIKARPHYLARAVVGHLAALRIDGYLKGPHTEELRDWLLDLSAPLPNFLRIHYWLHPFPLTVLTRDSVLHRLSARSPLYFWLMKFFPIAFLVTWDAESSYSFPELRSLDRFRSCAPEDVQGIPVDLKSSYFEHWPETPDDESFTLFGEGAVVVSPR